jgi:hypothetical protein
MFSYFDELIKSVGNDVTKASEQINLWLSQQEKIVNLSASDIRERSVDHIYNQIKIKIYVDKVQGKTTYLIPNQSQVVIQKVEEKLRGEGFSVSSESKDENTLITIEW